MLPTARRLAHRATRSGALLAVLAALACATAGDVGSQEPPPSASLLRVLAEAADGYRTGGPIWIVAGYDPPHQVLEVTDNAEGAQAALREAPPGFGLFGPYVTPADDVPYAQLSVLEVLIIVGPGDTLSLDPAQYDAAFWSLPAIEKFCVPYYARVYGAERAEDMLNQVKDEAAVGVVPHRSWSICRLLTADSLPAG